MATGFGKQLSAHRRWTAPKWSRITVPIRADVRQISSACGHSLSDGSTVLFRAESSIPIGLESASRNKAAPYLSNPSRTYTCMHTFHRGWPHMNTRTCACMHSTHIHTTLIRDHIHICTATDLRHWNMMSLIFLALLEPVP